jgi:hypothetical protein
MEGVSVRPPERSAVSRLVTSTRRRSGSGTSPLIPRRTITSKVCRFGTRGGIKFDHQFPADGDYTFNVKGVTGYFQAVLGGIQGEKLEVTIDGDRVYLYDWDKEISNTTGRGKWTPKIPVKAGLHVVGVTFLATNDIPGTELNRPVPADDEHTGIDSGIHLLSACRTGND